MTKLKRRKLDHDYRFDDDVQEHEEFDDEIKQMIEDTSLSFKDRIRTNRKGEPRK